MCIIAIDTVIIEFDNNDTALMRLWWIVIVELWQRPTSMVPSALLPWQRHINDNVLEMVIDNSSITFNSFKGIQICTEFCGCEASVERTSFILKYYSVGPLARKWNFISVRFKNLLKTLFKPTKPYSQNNRVLALRSLGYCFLFLERKIQWSFFCHFPIN